eukprot:47385_1
MEQNSKAKWRRILWARQPYDDNYTDETFLSLLETNDSVQEHRFSAIIPETGQITQQLSMTTIYVIVFFHVLDQSLPARLLMHVDASIIFLGYFLGVMLDSSKDSKFQLFQDTIWPTFKRVLVLLVCLFGVTPVLRTLTQSYSSDTIWALSLFCFALHLIFHDYSNYDVSVTVTSFQEATSINAAVMGSVLLGSRLHSSLLVFAFIVFAFELFVGFPIISRSVRKFSIRLHISLTFGVFLLTFGILYRFGDPGMLAVVYTIIVIFITFICPYWLEWIQRYRNPKWHPSFPDCRTSGLY